MERKLMLLLCLIFVLETDAQEINFSQFYEFPILRNPALSGLFLGDLRFVGAYHTQKANVKAPYQTQALSGELKLAVSEVDYLCLGLQIVNDVVNNSRLGRTELFPALSYHKSVNDDKDRYLSFGITGGAVQQRFDPSRLGFNDQFKNGAYSLTDPDQSNFSKTSHIYYDISAGISYNSVIGNYIKYYVGASYFHFTQPKVALSTTSDIRLNNKIIINGGVSASIRDNDKIIVCGDIYTQGGYKAAQGGLMYQHDFMSDYADETLSLSGGAFLRWNDALTPVIKLDYYNLALGLSYDVNVSNTRTTSANGAFEVTISYRNFLNLSSSTAGKARRPIMY